MGKTEWLWANAAKTCRYLKRNGMAAAWSAVRERLREERKEPYVLQTISDEERGRQRQEAEEWENPPLLSVVVPAFRTPESYLKALLDSLQEQTWPYWELILADAGEGDAVRLAVQERGDDRIRYVKLAENRGIADNTNAAVALAEGKYIGLLDHDDFLAPDALYEMAAALRRSERTAALRRSERATADKGRTDFSPVFLYSDEDKCDGEGKRFYEPNRKPDFNPDLLLSNNYICHFLMMEDRTLKRLGLRSGFDGAQDYDLVLRSCAGVFGELPEEAFVHIPRVLYHWRCHQASTAANPASKTYAYEAGKRALEDFCRERGWPVRVLETRHLGFYRTEYENAAQGMLNCRPDLGAVAGPLPSVKGKLVSGIYDRKDGEIRMRYEKLPKSFSGYMHRAVLMQDVEAADIRTMEAAGEWKEQLEKALEAVRGGADPVEESLRFCEKIRKAGQRILWDPGRKEGTV